ncbi:MAG: hypothetical protein K2X27_04345, partial [Candidatus Obscuribacterales bacterium]|nr:hypothetical protein [Candidatus Obscuribacterales bacterium]
MSSVNNFSNLWIRLHKQLPLLIGLLGFLAGCFYTFTTPKIYESQAKIWIRPRVAKREPSQYLESPLDAFYRNPLVTVCEVLKSNSVLGNAKKLLKDKLPEAAELEFEIGRNYEVNTIKDSDVLVVKFRSLNPETSRLVLQAVIDSFFELNKGSTEDLADETGEFLEKKFERTSDSLEQQRARLAEFQRAHAGVNADQQVDSLLVEELRASENLDENRAAIAALEAKLFHTRAQLHLNEEQMKILDKIEQDDEIKTLRQARLKHSSEMAELTSRLRIDHPEVALRRQEREKIVADLETRAKQIAGEEGLRMLNVEASFSRSQQAVLRKILSEESELAGLKAKMLKGESALREIQSRLKSVPNDQLEFSNLLHEIDSLGIELQNTEQQLMRFRMAKIMTEQSANLELVDRPDAPEFPSSPVLPVCLSGSLMLGCALAYLARAGLKALPHPYVSSLRDCAAATN